jgi:RimJ/RimL family protein N-acetyltransferase
MLTTDVQLIPTGPADYAGLTEGSVWRGFRVPPGGMEPADTLVMLAGLSDRLLTAQGWGTWVGVCDGETVVSIAVKAPISEGIVEIGYGVAPRRRRQGHATAAVLALLPILRDQAVRLIKAEAAIANPASGRVLTKTGFVVTGQTTDPEDGPLQLWELAL